MASSKKLDPEHGHKGEQPEPPRGRVAMGALRELEAEAWVRARGWQVIARNVRCREGELDIVAMESGKMIFIEVRSAWRGALVPAAESISPQKQQRLRRSASRFLRADPRALVRRREVHEFRFDLLAYSPVAGWEHFQDIA